MKPTDRKNHKYRGKIQTSLSTLSVNRLSRSVRRTNLGYAGYAKKSFLKERLNQEIGEVSDENLNASKLPSASAITEVARKVLEKSEGILSSSQDTEVYIFPTVDAFVKEHMGGVTGFTPYRNVMNIFVHIQPQSSIRELLSYLKSTVAHEYHHTVRFEYFPPGVTTTLLENMINEGLAEHFQEKTLKTIRWSLPKAFGRQRARRLFVQMNQKLLCSTDYRDYQKLFFGCGKYPVWSGYTIGYFLVDDFLGKKKRVSWEEVTKLSTEIISNESGWTA